MTTAEETLSPEMIARQKRDAQKAQLRPLANRRPELYDEDELSSDEFDAMMDMYNGTLASIEEGEIVKSTVLEIRENLVVLDIGFKSEGTIPLEEFKDMPDLKPGDQVEVLLEHLEDSEGSVVLSKKKADFMRVWERIRVAYESDQPVEGVLVKKIKGGVVVDLMGVDAFLPGSQIALRRVPNIDELLGQKYEFKIIKLNKRRRNIVVSRRVILETERAGKREKLMKELAKDQVRKGVVKNITDFGAFIDLGGVDGLLHITDMSWGRISHPSEMVQIGMELEVKVLDIDWERERISLGLKQLQPYPWKDVAEKYPVGTRVNGKVVSITNYGAFIELEPGIEGLVHISEMSWTRNVRHPSKIVSIGESHRGRGPQGRSGRGEDLARHEADRAGSVDGAAAQVPGRHAPLRQGPQPHRLRRVRRDRAGHRRPHPHLRHVVDEARPAPVGGREEG
jgi:small subunit ribosomal protein S1